ncbi:MAG: hypothetical protein KDA89_19025, partial [Planctomycetaceae bacterium]|nr:hypothetical protein [Planctomycetaceae bacterium]
GDHTHDEQPGAYQAVREILGTWHSCLWQVPGNHDDRSVLRAVFRDRVSGDGADPIRFAFEANGWLCLGLDTHLPGEVSGEMTVDQIRWLTTELADSAATRVALFLHHPPVEIGSTWMDSIGLRGRERLQEVAAADDRIRFICCGHVHHEFQTSVAAADVVTSPSTGIQFNPAGTRPNFAADAPGYRVIELLPEQFTTRVVRLPEIKYRPEQG